MIGQLLGVMSEDALALIRAGPAPHTMLLAVAEGVVQALDLDRTLEADTACLLGLDPVLRVEPVPLMRGQ